MVPSDDADGGCTVPLGGLFTPPRPTPLRLRMAGSTGYAIIKTYEEAEGDRPLFGGRREEHTRNDRSSRGGATADSGWKRVPAEGKR